MLMLQCSTIVIIIINITRGRFLQVVMSLSPGHAPVMKNKTMSTLLITLFYFKKKKKNQYYYYYNAIIIHYYYYYYYHDYYYHTTLVYLRDVSHIFQIVSSAKKFFFIKKECQHQNQILSDYFLLFTFYF